jgi:hypothetical protein
VNGHNGRGGGREKENGTNTLGTDGENWTGLMKWKMGRLMRGQQFIGDFKNFKIQLFSGQGETA